MQLRSLFRMAAQKKKNEDHCPWRSSNLRAIQVVFRGSLVPASTTSVSHEVDWYKESVSWFIFRELEMFIVLWIQYFCQLQRFVIVLKNSYKNKWFTKRLSDRKLEKHTRLQQITPKLIVTLCITLIRTTVIIFIGLEVTLYKYLHRLLVTGIVLFRNAYISNDNLLENKQFQYKDDIRNRRST